MQKYGPNKLIFVLLLAYLIEILLSTHLGLAANSAVFEDRPGAESTAVNGYLLGEESGSAFTPRKDAISILAQQLKRYRTIAADGGWPAIPPGPLLKKGSQSKTVAVLRRRLVSENYLTTERQESDVFDEEVTGAVKSFQQCHGLKVDGIVGPMTLKELNVPAAFRADQIEINMKRLDNFSNNVGERYILVNTADYRLDVMENGRPVLTMKVVVGKPYWVTPEFSARMTYLIINPSWNVPSSIVSEELLPHIKKDPGYLAEQNFMVFKGWGENTEVVDPSTVDWRKMSAKRVPYRFRQLPGPLNPLGRIKFMFPNKFNVYLHDTPAKGLFDKGTRAFSHGCIRIEKPLELARYLLQDNPEPLQGELEKILATGKEKIVNLARPIDVHVVYLTAWPDAEGRIQFRDDIYGRDAALRATLQRSP